MLVCLFFSLLDKTKRQSFTQEDFQTCPKKRDRRQDKSIKKESLPQITLLLQMP
jgi:hypothetical protein